MSNMKRVLVTGGNKGIGFEIVKGLAQQGCFVFLGSRDAARGEEAVRSLPESQQKIVKVVPLDVTAKESVAKAAEIVATACNGEPLFALVNNAGGSEIGGHVHADYEATLEMNFGGVVRVTSAFFPLLAKDGRIVMVSSGGAPSFVAGLSMERQQMFLAIENKTDVTFSQITALIEECRAISASNTEDEQTRAAAFAKAGLGNADINHPYGLAKSCVNAYTIKLARDNPSMKINACSPGFIETDLTKKLGNYLGKTPKEMGTKPVEDGAMSALYLLLDANVPGSGWYFGSDAKRSPPHLYREPGTPAYDGGGKFDAATTLMLFDGSITSKPDSKL